MDGDLRKELDALRSDIASVQADLARIAKMIGKGTGEAAEDAGETIRRRFEELQHAIQEQISGILDPSRVRRSVEGVGQRIEERPLLSMLIAFSIGFLISLLIGRR